MRITQTMMANQYTRRVVGTTNSLNYVNKQVGTGRLFFKASENPANAAKAYMLRRQSSQVADYTSNLQDLQDMLLTKESCLNQVNKSLEDAYGIILEVMNGPSQTQEQMDLAATQLKEIQSTIIHDMNTKYGDKYIFGGSCVSEAPFELVGNKLYYRGVDVEGEKTYTYPEGHALAGTRIEGMNYNKTDVLELLDKMSDDAIYSDLGFGLEFKDDGSLNASTAFNCSTPGINILGYTKVQNAGEEYSSNIVCLIGQIAQYLENGGSQKGMDEFLTKFKEERQTVLNSITKIGSDCMFLDYTQTRLDNISDNIDTKISNTEYIDEEKAIMNLNTIDYMYQALLKTSNMILSKSFIDFMG